MTLLWPESAKMLGEINRRCLEEARERMVTFPAAEIASIEIGRSGQFCDACDQRFPDNWVLGEQR